MSIQYEEWQQECARLVKDDDGLTVKELVEMMGFSKSTVLSILRKGVAEGTYAKGWSRKINDVGRAMIIPVYRVVKPQSDKGKKSK